MNRQRVVLFGASLLVGAGCASAGTADLGPPQPAVAQELLAATAPRQPMNIVFDWRAQESDARFTGRGVARIQPPYRGRLDLFGPRGETYLSAVLFEDDLRLPGGGTSSLLPPPSLLWASVGVFRPPAGAQLVGTSRADDQTTLEYQSGEDRWRFLIRGGRLESAELERKGSGRHTMVLEGAAALGLPKTAVYRDWAAFRELHLTLNEATNVESFPADTWVLPPR